MFTKLGRLAALALLVSSAGCEPAELYSHTQAICVLDCTERACGSDGCGGVCGTCDDGVACIEGACSPGGECTPSCDGAVCGSDGCGGVCGVCGTSEICSSGACVPSGSCMPECTDRQCGDDGCGGSCGSCAGECSAGQCVDEGCTPECDGRECGSDGCGGSCGTCSVGLACNGVGTCAPTGGSCPPTGDRGPREGEVAPNVMLHDCAGNPVELDSVLCGGDVGWVISHQESCGTCRAKLGTLEGWYDGMPQDRMRVVVVVTQTSDFQPATQATCQAVEDRYGLEDITVLYGNNNDFLNNFWGAGSWFGVLVDGEHRIIQKGALSRTVAEAAL